MSEEQTTRPVNFIRFHGLNLLVVEHAGVEYIPARPLCELAGMQWKSAQRTLQSGDNAKLYGAKRLFPPEIDGQRTTGGPENGVLYLRLDRSQMYLARISTDNMRAKGNDAGADVVLALQLEYADVLHAWETTGTAVKKGRGDAVTEALALLKAKQSAKPEDRAWIGHLLRERLAEIGIPESLLDGPQADLFKKANGAVA